SQGLAINTSGQITGGSTTTGESASHAFVYSGGKMTDLGTLGGSNSGGAGINALGQVVGSSSTANSDTHAFLFSGGPGMVDLNTLVTNGEGWTLEFAQGINEAGQITGTGINPSGFQRAFLLTPATISFSTLEVRLGLTGKPPTKFSIR